MNTIVFMALLATPGTWLVTALGAATVVFFKSPNPKALNLMLGFASGVMIAASFWSLLQPAIERAEATSALPAYLVATAGFLCGALQNGGYSTEALMGAITIAIGIGLQNFPEGAAVSVPLDSASPSELGQAGATNRTSSISPVSPCKNACASSTVREQGLTQALINNILSIITNQNPTLRRHTRSTDYPNMTDSKMTGTKNRTGPTN